MRSSISLTCQSLRLVISLLAVFMLAPTAYAQFDTATVLGTVTDTTGSAVPGATVTLKNTATGITVTAQTDENGNYQFSNVKIGPYQVTAESSGFSKGLVENIQVTVNARQRVDVALKAGNVTETVTVTAE